MSRINITEAIGLAWKPSNTGTRLFTDARYQVWFYAVPGTAKYRDHQLRPGVEVPLADCLITTTSDDITKVVCNIPNYNSMVQLVDVQLESIVSLIATGQNAEALRILKMVQQSVKANLLHNILERELTQ